MAGAPPRAVLLFEGFRLDLGRAYLLGPGGAELALCPKTFDMLRHLVENAGRLVSRDELLQAVWPDVTVSDESVSQCVAEVRRALGDGAQRLLKTVPKRGYLFAAEVARGGSPPKAGGEPAATTPAEAARESRAVAGERRRRLAAILAADVVGYSRLVGADEEGTLARLSALFRESVQPAVAARGGRVFKLVGDAFLAEFPSAVEAVRCAIALQEAAEGQEAGEPDERRVRLRIGVHLGDVVAEGGDLLGDGVNLAARLEGLAEPGGVVVSAAVAEAVRGAVPFGLEDLGERALRNIERPIRAFRVVAGTGARPVAPAPAECHTLALPDRPSLAVLPFANLSGDPEQEYLADAVVEDVIAALSRIRWLFVIARNSAFTYRGRAVDVRQVGRELGVHYVLEGSIRKANTRVRIAGRLVEAETGAHVWAERFEGDLGDLFALQDEITAGVAGAIEPALAAAEQARTARKPPESLDALESFHRGQWHFHRATAADNGHARRLFQHSIELAPDFAASHAGLALVHLYDAWMFRPAARAELVPLGVGHARRAVALDSLDATAHRALSVGLKMLGRYAESLAEAEAALRLSPSSAWAHAALGAVLTFNGQPARAVEPLRRAMRLSPFDPQSWVWLKNMALAYYLARDYEAAAAAAREFRRLRPDIRPSSSLLVAALAQSGRVEEAQVAAAEALAQHGEAELTASLARPMTELREEDHRHLLEGWRRAGLAV